MVDKIDKDFNLDDDPDFDNFGNLGGNLDDNDNNLIDDEQGGGLDDNDDLDDYTIRIFGLDNSGKSTLMMNLIDPKEGNVAEITEDFNADVLIYNKSKINFWDIAGKKDYRQYWKNYYHSSDAFFFVIDISNKSRYDEAKDALHKLILAEQENEGVPILIYANKSDLLQKPVKPEDVYTILGIKNKDNVGVQICSAKKLTGMKEGLDWIFSKIKMN